MVAVRISVDVFVVVIVGSYVRKKVPRRQGSGLGRILRGGLSTIKVRSVGLITTHHSCAPFHAIAIQPERFQGYTHLTIMFLSLSIILTCQVVFAGRSAGDSVCLQ